MCTFLLSISVFLSLWEIYSQKSSMLIDVKVFKVKWLLGFQLWGSRLQNLTTHYRQNYFKHWRFKMLDNILLIFHKMDLVKSDTLVSQLLWLQLENASELNSPLSGKKNKQTWNHSSFLTHLSHFLLWKALFHWKWIICLLERLYFDEGEERTVTPNISLQNLQYELRWFVECGFIFFFYPHQTIYALWIGVESSWNRPLLLV